MALVSLCAGIASWVMVPVAGAIAAIVCGHLARKEIRQSGEDGDTFAVIGMVAGYLHMAAVCLGGCVLAAFYGGLFALVASSAAYH